VRRERDRETAAVLRFAVLVFLAVVAFLAVVVFFAAVFLAAIVLDVEEDLAVSFFDEAVVFFVVVAFFAVVAVCAAVLETLKQLSRKSRIRAIRGKSTMNEPSASGKQNVKDLFTNPVTVFSTD
jgi:H+/Cl- antiporter ClcA